jgi:predicted ribosome quality control (RQC) complex YloA/Tae2 family protein
MSWIDINVWIKENINFLRDSVIDNIYGFKDSLVLRLRSRDGEKRLLISKPGFYIFLSPETIFDKKDLSFEENFILLLRRYVRDCKIRDVRQQPCERIVEIEILCRDSRYTLTIELIPRGVIVLRDENNKITVLNRSLKTKDSAFMFNSLYIYTTRNIYMYCA